MALFDKVKAQAAQVAQKAQEAGRTGQARLEDAQARKQLDALYRSLGAAVYAQHAGQGNEDTAAEIEQLYGDLDQFQAAHGTAAMAAPTAPDPTSAPGTTQGDFKLE